MYLSAKSKTSYGHDAISIKTVKHVIKQIVKPLTNIFNRSLICGSFPDDMKFAKIIPVFKSGPLLFFLYLHDMYDVSKLLHIILFADDTKCFYSVSNIDDVTNVINNELKQLGLWFRANKLSLNVNKTHIL